MAMGDSKLSVAKHVQGSTSATPRRAVSKPPPPPPAGALKRRITSPLPPPRSNTPAASSRTRFDYLPSIDGLRALAIAAVMLYHADVPWMPGGFIGVEVFLAISGFLITSLLAREFRRHGSVDITDFWARRARRLLPAMWAIIFSVTLYAAYFLPDELASLRGDAIAALGYAANWVLIFDHKSYFESAGRPSLLKHFWSLAIEQQFYLLWPGVFSMFVARIPRAVSVALLIAAAAASAAWMGVLFNPDVDPSRLYFGTDTRASGLLLGAALALLQPTAAAASRSRIVSHTLEAAGILALGALIAACFVVDEYDPPLYLGGFFAVAGLTVIVIAAATAPESAFVGHVLRLAPLRWLGVRSYSLYLWHFPIFMIMRPDLDLPFGGFPSLVLRVAVALVFSELSFRFIEQPVRDGALGRLWAYMTQDHGPLRWMLTGAWALSIAALCIEVGAAKPPPVEPSSDDVYVAKPKPLGTPEGFEEPALAGLGVNREKGSLGAALPSHAQRPNVASVATKSSKAEPVRAPQEVVRLASVAPLPNPNPSVRQTRVFALGDSVMLGAARHLRAPGAQLTIDAVVGRQASAAINVLEQLKNSGEKPEVVVIHIGNNGTFREPQFDEMMKLLKNVPRVVFVNTKVPRRWQDPNNAVLSAGVRKHSRVTLVDWLSFSEGHPEWFRSDGYHLQPDGAAAYATLLKPYYSVTSQPQQQQAASSTALY
jgi:peptidoglycan/LPS O-acetylase OafA/YrhL